MVDSSIPVLVVDDRAELVETVARSLERVNERLDVRTETDSTAVVDALAEDSVDCVVSDYQMPELDGLGLLDRVRDQHPELPFILFTGRGSEEIASEAIAAGVTDYLQKGTGESQYAVLANRIENAVERRRAEAELREERRRYELIGRASGEAFWDWDMETDEVERSDGYARIFGFEPEEVGEEADWWVDRVHPDDEDEVSRVANRAMDAGDEWYEVDYRVETGDGSYKPVRTRAYIVYDEGDPVRIVGAVTDISDLVRQNERLDEFASIVSHDLRNPLNVLTGSLEMAAETGDREHVDRCFRAVDRMERLIDDLLTLARQGERIDEPEPVDLAALAERCRETVETGDAEVRIETERTVRADEGRLEQLLENLFRNAVEHGSTSPRSQTREDAGRASSSEPSVADAPEDAVEHGSTTADTGTAQEDDGECDAAAPGSKAREADGLTVTVGDLVGGFYVEDDGVGIPEADRDDVFENGYSTAREGTGFGLSIVEGIASAHGWEVAVTDGNDGGARFEITLGEGDDHGDAETDSPADGS